MYGVGTLVISAINTSLQFRQFGGEPEDVADAYADSLPVLIALTIVGIVSAVLWALVVRQLTDRHTRLTGESAGLSLFVVRHAKAGSRRDWDGDDSLRPLSKDGRRQADAVAARLARRGCERAVVEPVHSLHADPRTTRPVGRPAGARRGAPRRGHTVRGRAGARRRGARRRRAVQPR